MNGKKKRRKKLYPHKWAIYKDLPAEVFEPLPFEVFMDWKVAGWLLPENVFCIIRTTHTVTKKVKEYTYKKPFFPFVSFSFIHLIQLYASAYGAIF